MAALSDADEDLSGRGRTHSSNPHDADLPAVRRRRAVAGWLLLGVLVTAVHGVWTLAMPLTGAPDEQSHVVHAAAVARGQWSGELGPPPPDESRPGGATTVRLPSDYAAVLALPNCFMFQPEQPASCQESLPDPGAADVEVETFAGQYPPLYYALVGWPSLLLTAGPAIYAMRLVSGALLSALLIWGAACARSFLPAPLVAWAALVAVTPMCLFFGASVNPQGLETAAGFAFWAACLALARSSGAPRPAALIQAAVAGALLINSRASGPLWAAVAVIIAALLARPGRLRVLWSARGARWVLLSLVGSAALAGAWAMLHGGVVTTRGGYPQYAGTADVIRQMLPSTNTYLLELVGTFGWRETPSPWLTTVPWYVAAGALLLLALAVRSSIRERGALLLGMLAVVAAPIALQAPTAADTGIIWQGRYVLPLAVGVPLVAAAMLADLDAAAADVARRIVLWVVPALAIANVAAFWTALRRFAEGSAGEWLTLSPQWSSPLGYLPAVAIYAALTAAAGAVAWRSAAAVDLPDGSPSDGSADQVAGVSGPPAGRAVMMNP